jgi:hypothetical protein
MASRTLIDTALQLYKSLGGNTSKVLGTRTNVNFLGKGKSSEMMVDMDINTEALGVLPKSKAVEELESSMGYLTSGKLNDMQANKLISNMQKMKDFYDPAPAPANITDMVTGTRNLDREGLASLRLKGDDFGYVRPEDLPPPGSRGGPEDIAAPIQSAEETIKNLAKSEGVDAAETILPTGAGLEAIKSVKNNNLIVNDIVNTIYSNAGVSANAQPVVRANAREFLNRIKDLSNEPGNNTLADVMEIDDFKFMTEGGGGGMGDPLLLVQKYFGPKVASSVAQLDGADDIQKFAENLVKIKDAKGNTITSRFFDPESVDDFEFADGGRVPFFRGKLVGKALGLAKKAAATASGGKQMGYGDIRKYGLEAEDISRLFKDVAMDKSLVGKEKTLYMQRLNQVLKNPDDFPEGIREIQQMLGIDPIGFKGGGLAEILEV